MKTIQKSFIITQKPVTCKVVAGRGLEKEIVAYCKKQQASKYVIVTDTTVQRLHANRLKDFLLTAGCDTMLIAVAPGESSKSREVKARIEDEMFAQKVGRDTVLIALGGGVIGDLAGFVAATYMRGIPYIQIPTTTIAQSDSSYGGKTAIDVPAGKNLVGAYKQPDAVFVDSDYLKTLDTRNYVSGLAEVVKHGLIKDKKLYTTFVKNMKSILAREGAAYEKSISEVMMRSIDVKRYVVIRDEREDNLRKILNYGHTIGHAIEKLSHFSLLHGEAITIGMCAEAFLAYKAGILSHTDFIEQKMVFESMGLPTKIPANMSLDAIIQTMRIDKKARKQVPEFSLIKKIGTYATNKEGTVAIRFDEAFIEKALTEYKKLP